MRKVIDVSAYPLAPALTRRVLGYLAYFRLFIAIALSAAFITGLLSAQVTIRNPALAGAVLLAYLGFSLYFLRQVRRKDDHHYDLALQSLILDVVLIALLLHTFQGVAVLLHGRKDDRLVVLAGLARVMQGAAVLLHSRESDTRIIL